MFADVSRVPVCVIGLGLIGGSITRRLSRRGREVFGYDRCDKTIHAACAAGFEVSSDLTAVLDRARQCEALIVIALPFSGLDEILCTIRQRSPHCPLTDVISVKTPVVDLVRAHGLEQRFVGSHPMAGTAYSGWEASHDELFSQAIWAISVDDDVADDVWVMVLGMILDCHARALPVYCDEHDRAVAVVSHLPHMCAEALASCGAKIPLGLGLAAGSFRDATRVAGSSPDLVQAMCQANAHALTRSLDEFIAQLCCVRDQLQHAEEITDFVRNGYEGRHAYENFSYYSIQGIVVGEPHWQERLAYEGLRGGVIDRLLDRQ